MTNLFDQSYERATLTKIVAASGTPERITGRTISLLQRYGTTRKCRATTSVPHGYTNGARVYISGAVEPEFNNTTTGFMITVASATEFYFFTAGTTSAATGTVLCYADMFVRQATVLGQKAAQTDNAGDVRIGTPSADGAQSYRIPPGGEVYLNGGMPDESRVNLGSYYVDVVTNADGVVVLYS